MQYVEPLESSDPSNDTYFEELELAAKAAGYVVQKRFSYVKSVTCGAPNPFEGIEFRGLALHDGKSVRSPWNSKEDDGDALRLRNRIGAVICDEGSNVYVSVCKYPMETIEIREPYKSDTEGGYATHASVDAATRRAITRAAAEIGKAMQ